MLKIVRNYLWMAKNMRIKTFSLLLEMSIEKNLIIFCGPFNSNYEFWVTSMNWIKWNKCGELRNFTQVEIWLAHMTDDLPGDAIGLGPLIIKR